MNTAKIVQTANSIGGMGRLSQADSHNLSAGYKNERENGKKNLEIRWWRRRSNHGSLEDIPARAVSFLSSLDKSRAE